MIDVTPTFVIASALATRDFQDVHHDRDRAVARGAKDIFVNILTTTGLVQRYVSGWAGPDAVVRAVSIRLGVPCHAGETLTLSGQVTAADGDQAGGLGDRPVRPRRPRHGHRPDRDAPVMTAAIAGIGATEFSKDSGRSELRLAAEAVRAALADAALRPSDVDGLVTFTMDSNAEIAVARELGIPGLTFFSQIGYGGGAACATVHQAAMAIATGAASVVVCYRALNERSGRRFGRVAAGAVADADHLGHRQRLALPDGHRHAGRDRRHARPPLHALLRRDQRGLRPGDGRGSPPRRDQPAGLVLPAPGHARRAPGLAVDRRTAPAARLLPGERRRRGRRGHQPGPGPRPAAPARRDPRRRAGQPARISSP